MTVRWLRVALTVVVATVLGLAPTSSVGAASFNCDPTYRARDTQQIEADVADPFVLSDAREESA